jgi:hypothetical protein
MIDGCWLGLDWMGDEGFLFFFSFIQLLAGMCMVAGVCVYVCIYIGVCCVMLC